MDTTDLTQKGIAALKTGDAETARKFLGYATRHNPEDIQAWLWLAGAVETEDEQIACLQKVLEIDPHHRAARRGLAQLVDDFSPPTPPAAEYVPPFVDENAVPRPQSQAARPQPQKSKRTAAFSLNPQPDIEATAERRVFAVRPTIAPGVLGSVLLVLILILAAYFIIYTKIIADPFTTLALLLYTGLVALLFVVILRTLWRRIFYLYKLTTAKLVVHTGTSRQNIQSIPLEDILAARCRQNLWSKIFNYGTIVVAVKNQPKDLKLVAVPQCQRHTRVMQKLLAQTSAE